MSALWTAPASGDDLVQAITTARRLRDAALGCTLAHLAARASRAVRRLARRLAEARHADRTRRELLGLDARQLRDIGLTRADVVREADGLRPLYSCGATASTALQRLPGGHGGRAC